MQLRPYQILAKTEIREAFSSGSKRVIFCCPTGSGKTVTFASICQGAVSVGNRVMIVVDRKELLDQAREKLINYGLSPAIITAGRWVRTPRASYIATVQTLVRRPMPDVDLLVIDEAHKQTFDKILEREEYKNTFIIGATATPIRRGKMTQLSDHYDTMIEPTDIQQLIKDGYLAPAITYGATVDTSSIKMRGADYDTGSMLNFFEKSVLYGDVVEKYKELADGTKALVFNINVEHSKKMKMAFLNAGYYAGHIDGKTPKTEREQILHDFKLGHIKVLCNCDILTTGYDEWTIETIIVNRATESLPLWLQMAGRGSRPAPSDDLDKTHFNLIDMGGNVFKHGFWESPREYSLTHKYRKTEGVAPIKECPQCAALIHASVTLCSYCGHIFPKTGPIIAESEFVRLDYGPALPDELKSKKWTEMSLEELEQVREIKSYKIGWVLRQIADRDDISIEDYAELKGYKPGWIYKTKERLGIA